MNNLDNSIEIVLGEAGVNQSEVAVYLAGRGKTKSSAELIAATDMPRPTVMAALKSLQQFGLCSTTRRDGRSLVYTMLPAQNIKAYLGQQARSIDDLMNRFDQLDDAPQDRVTISQVDTHALLQDLLEQALRCKSRQWHIIAPHDNALRHLPPAYLSYFKRIRKERQIQSETLWESKIKGQNIALSDVLMRKPRYVPKSISENIPSLLLAFDDKILIIDGTSQPTAVLISSKSTADTFRLLFTMAWRFAKSA